VRVTWPEPIRITERARRWLAPMIALAAALALPLAAHARPARPPASAPRACGVLEAFGGTAQLLDSSRNLLLQTSPGAMIPCGSWLSVDQGWARVQHRDGHRIAVGSDTFVQFRDQGETAVLFKGQIHVDAADGGPAFQALTANARARLARGRAILVFSPYDEESQLIAVAGQASLENRFQPARRITVRAGEATSLNFKVLRVVPSTPRIVALSSLRQKLADLHLTERELVQAMESARERAERRLVVAAPSAARPLEEGGHAVIAPRRAPAGDYRRHLPAPDDAKARGRWLSHLTGGAGAEPLLHPGRARAKPRIVDPLADEHRRRERDEAAEKRRLMEALSRIESD
jgi:hypothetical protein